MSQLAITGGRAVFPKKKQWPQWPIHEESDVALLSKITRSNKWSFDGAVEWGFAEAFTKYQGAKYGACCANGTVGIQLALEALGIGAHDEVIVPGMTWQATAAAVADVNAIPVLTDVEPDTWNLDMAAVEANITRKTRAIIIVHLYGAMGDITRLQKICKKHKLALIEDCAHQHGSFWKGKGVGSLGDVASFSFQESKVLASGEGGFNMCKSKALFERLYSLRNCGRYFEAHPPVFGMKKAAKPESALQSGNYRITEWQAAILAGGLKRLDQQVKLRDANAIHLNAQLAQIPGILPMRRRTEVTQQSYFNFTFRLDLKELKGIDNRLFAVALNEELGVPGAFEPPYQPLNNCSLYKPQTKERHKISADYWKAINPKRFKLPVSKDAHEKSGLAVHHALLLASKKDMDHVAEAVKKVVDNLDQLRALKKSPTKAFKARAVW